MKILLTGGSGDLGKVLASRLQAQGDTSLRFDIREPKDNFGQFVRGSILDRESLKKSLVNVDCIVHIAAWHGFHEFTKQKNVYDFWDLNVTGTFNVLQAALEANIKNVVFISSESVSEKNGTYGWSKVMSEQIAERYFEQHHLNIITLRPRAFIPYWNPDVYQSYLEWIKWYWKGAVHINDVAQAVIQSINLLTKQKLSQHLILPVDGAYEYSADDLLNWNNAETFKKYYNEFYELAKNLGLDPTVKPSVQDISETTKWLNYKPQFSLLSALKDLAQYGEKGPAIT